MNSIKLIAEPPAEGYLISLCPAHLEILEQPVKYYRYRYESEITEGRVGGLLLGRSSSATGGGNSGKSYIRLRVSGIDPRIHKKLQLTVCTVNPDKEPHPYYLHGDSCQGGYFKLEKAVDERTQSTWDVSFDRLAVICIQKTVASIRDGLRSRLESVPPLVSCPAEPSRRYDGRNLGRIRLAFSLSTQLNFTDEWLVTQLFSEEISDMKEHKAFELDALNPAEAAPSGGSEIAIYVGTPTTGVNRTDARVVFGLLEGDNESPPIYTFPCEIKEMKKHLITVVAPDVTRYVVNEQTKAIVTVHVGEAVSSGLHLLFRYGLPVVPPLQPGATRKHRR